MCIYNRSSRFQAFSKSLLSLYTKIVDCGKSSSSQILIIVDGLLVSLFVINLVGLYETNIVLRALRGKSIGILLVFVLYVLYILDVLYVVVFYENKNIYIGEGGEI